MISDLTSSSTWSISFFYSVNFSNIFCWIKLFFRCWIFFFNFRKLTRYFYFFRFPFIFRNIIKSLVNHFIISLLFYSANLLYQLFKLHCNFALFFASFMFSSSCKFISIVGLIVILGFFVTFLIFFSVEAYFD